MKKKICFLGILTMLILSLLVFCACDKDDVKNVVDTLLDENDKLSAPTNFDYDGRYVTWNKVTNATSYLVTLNGGTELEYNSPSFRYENATGEDFKVSVKAKASDYDTSDAVEYTFSPIGKVTELVVAEDGSLSWSEVDFADSYEVTVGPTKTIVEQTMFSDLPVGQSQVTVRAKRTSEPGVIFYSTGKTSKTVTICADVDAKKITYKDGVIAWSGVSGAQTYELYINGQLENEVTGTMYDYDAHNGNFEVGIKVLGNHTNTFDGKTTVEKNFVYLEAATDVHVADGILVWQAVPEAESYTLRVNGTDLRQPLTECQYTGLVAGRETRIQIRANSTDTAYYASWTDEKSFLVLAAPEIRWVEGNLDGDSADTIVWDSVEGATGFTVKVTSPDGLTDEVPLSSEARAYGNAYLTTGEYSISVKSLAEKTNPNVCDSLYCQAIKVVRLGAPKAASSNFIKSYPDNVASGFDVSFTSVAGASNYELWRDDTRVNTTNSGKTQFARVNDFVDEAVMTEQIYTYRIKSLGSSYSSVKRTRVLDSLSSDTLNFDITVLAMPSNPKMEGFNISFGSVSKANKYSINISGSIKDSETTSYSLSSLASGSYEVKVNARGNQTNILSSNYTVPINVIRLVAPENIKISTEGSEGVLVFDGDEDALSYELVINGETKEIASSNVENIAKEISTSGTQMHLRAIRNQYDFTKAHYYMTSPDSATKTFTKLTAPTFGTAAFSNTQLIWNAITNINNYSPTYKVYDDSDIAYNGTINGATMDISQLSGGRSYNFKVKAIGDGTRYINSDLSEQRSIYKLATPDVSVNAEKTGYVWNSVSNTTNYAVYVDGVISNLEIHNYEDTYTYIPKFSSVKKYMVTVYAKGDGGIETIDSDPCLIEQEVKQLDTPNFSFGYTATTVGDGEIKMTITKASPFATGYIYIVKGVQSQPTTELTYYNDPNNVGSYPLSVYALGGSFGNEGEYYIDSQMCGGNANYTITLLPQPNKQTITISRDGILSWTTIANASAYSITLTINSKEYEEIIVNQGNTYDIAKMLVDEETKWKDVTNVTVKIIAKGGNDKVVDSVATEGMFNNISH